VARTLAGAVDPFALIMFGGVAALVLVLLALGRFYPGSGAEQLDWRPTRSAEAEVANEIDDLDQMREAVNRRRRARGEAELTEDDVRERVAEDLRATIARGGDTSDEEQLRATVRARREARRAHDAGES
jgi:hypothetical protein